MYVFYNVYGEVARGIEPTQDLQKAIELADRFELIVYDTETAKDVYDIRDKGKEN